MKPTRGVFKGEGARHPGGREAELDRAKNRPV
jgi:hypothetical protein